MTLTEHKRLKMRVLNTVGIVQECVSRRSDHEWNPPRLTVNQGLGGEATS